MTQDQDPAQTEQVASLLTRCAMSLVTLNRSSVSTICTNEATTYRRSGSRP